MIPDRDITRIQTLLDDRKPRLEQRPPFWGRAFAPKEENDGRPDLWNVGSDLLLDDHFTESPSQKATVRLTLLYFGLK